MDSGFGNLWRKSGTNYAPHNEKAVIGILVFEVSTLMSKLVNLWECLSDKQINRLRKEVVHSPGVCKFVSVDANYLMNLVLVEIMDDLGGVVESVARFGKRCVDPLYHHLEHVIEYFVEFDSDWCVWEYRYMKMERKVKKMVRFSGITAQLYRELEELAELEVKLHDVREKITRQRQEVNKLREMTPWVRSYDYTVRLLLRSLLTILARIKQVFGIDQMRGTLKSQIYGHGSLLRCQSMYVPKQVSLSKDNHLNLDSKLLGRSVSNVVKRNSDAIEFHECSQSSLFCGKPSQGNIRRLADVNLIKRCNTDQSNSKFTQIISSPKLFRAPLSTLGGAALAVHYANIILFINKLALCPEFISLDARDELYDMLPAAIRSSVRAKLKLFTKTLASSIYDPTLAAHWNLTMRGILRLLVPLAQNMTRWRSERNFEKQRIVCGSTVCLVQTLYFANQKRIDAAITELLVGLNYISRFSKEFSCIIAASDMSEPTVKKTYLTI